MRLSSRLPSIWIKSAACTTCACPPILGRPSYRARDSQRNTTTLSYIENGRHERASIIGITLTGKTRTAGFHTASLDKYECTSLQDAILDRTYYKLGSTSLKQVLAIPIKELGVERNLSKVTLETVWMALARHWWTIELQGFEHLDPAYIWLRNLNRLDKNYFSQLGELTLDMLGEIKVPVWQLSDMQYMQLSDVLNLKDGLDESMLLGDLWSKENSPLIELLRQPKRRHRQSQTPEKIEMDGEAEADAHHRKRRDRSIVLIRTGLVPGVILSAILLDRLTGPKEISNSNAVATK